MNLTTFTAYAGLSLRRVIWLIGLPIVCALFINLMILTTIGMLLSLIVSILIWLLGSDKKLSDRYIEICAGLAMGAIVGWYDFMRVESI